MAGKLRLGFYPYTYARISVMKGELIEREEWDELLKMGLNELLRYLQDSGYKEEIDSIGSENRDIAMLEMALNQNLMRIFAKLRKISDEKVQKVISEYLMRYDMENYKTIIRAMATKASIEEAEKFLLPSINYPTEHFIELLKKENIKEVMKEIAEEMQLAFEINADGMELFEMENSLDRAYFEELFAFAKRIRGQGFAFREFIEAELNILNIKILLRLKKEGFSGDDIKKNMIMPNNFIMELAGKEGIAAIAKELNKAGITSIKADESSPESDILAKLEIDLDIALLKKEMLLMHQFPLTVNVILGFMLAKEIEVKNLKVLLKGKMLGLEEEYLSNLLAVA